MEATTEAVGVPESELDRIIRDLDENGGRLPKQAIREARACREQIVPRLIKAIEDATAATQAEDVPEGNAPFFALFLLTEFRAKEALPAIAAAVSLPDDLPFDLFGDAITETLNRVLATLAADRLDAIDELICNRAINEYVRWEAAESYVTLVCDERLDRDAAVAALRQHLRDAIACEDDIVAGPLASALLSLAPAEAREEIAEAFRLNLIDLSLFDLDYVDKAIEQGEAWIQRGLERHEPGAIDDVIEELKDWSCFAEEETPRPTWSSVDALLENSLDDPLEDRLEAGALLASQAVAAFDADVEAHDEPAASEALPVEPRQRIGRNEPCPCGSGKKFKRCCGGRH